MPVFPTGYRGSTTLNMNVTGYDQLVTRIEYQMGAPLVNIEVSRPQVYSFIDQAIEFYTKYAGQTEEYLVFDSRIYRASGIKIDDMLSLSYEFNSMTTMEGSAVSASYDYDLMNYRKVVDVFSVEPGESTGINTLFTLEQAFAQQTYFSYMLGNAGFDLITWHILKSWLETREKVLAQKIYYRFDPRTQVLKLIPPPNENSGYYGVMGCWVERPIRDIILERWVFFYALALTKIAVAHVRGKYGGATLFGGGSPNPSELMSQGQAEKEKLENELYQMYGEAYPPSFFLG